MNAATVTRSVVELRPARNTPAADELAEAVRLEAAQLAETGVEPIVRESEEVPGLELERHGRFVTVRYLPRTGRLWARYFVTGGRAYILEGSTLGTWPIKVDRVVERVLAAYAERLA
ncbi:hypothetical protein D3C72_1136520 [compost metagenome]